MECLSLWVSPYMCIWVCVSLCYCIQRFCCWSNYSTEVSEGCIFLLCNTKRKKKGIIEREIHYTWSVLSSWSSCGWVGYSGVYFCIFAQRERERGTLHCLLLHEVFSPFALSSTFVLSLIPPVFAPWLRLEGLARINVFREWGCRRYICT